MIVRRALAGLAVGGLFGVGLATAQMTNPDKILAFLNLAGHWDGSLLFVMGAAVAVTFVGYRLVAGTAPLFADRQQWPTAQRIDARLVGGAVVFGVGWGLAGYCPGPAVAAIASGSIEPPLFVAAMLAGSFLAGAITRPGKPAQATGSPSAQ